MPRRSAIHRDLRTPKYRSRVVKLKTKKKKPRHAPDWQREWDGDRAPARGKSSR